MMKFPVLYGLCHAMVRSSSTKSGYETCTRDHLGRDFSQCRRLEGFAAAVNGGYTDRLALVGGGYEGVHSAIASYDYLIEDLGVDRYNVVCLDENCKGTEDSLKVIEDAEGGYVTTSLNHLARTSFMAYKYGFLIIPAEAFEVAFGHGSENREIEGIADLLNETYNLRSR